MATTSVRNRQSELQRFLAFQGNVRWVRAGREAWRVPLRIVSATMAVSDTIVGIFVYQMCRYSGEVRFCTRSQ